LISSVAIAFLFQVNTWEMVSRAKPIPMAVLFFLLVFSLLSWAIIFSKWNSFRQARTSNLHFIRAFRKAPGLEAVAVAAEQFRSSPLVAVFDFGFEEVDRQIKAYRKLRNPVALERSLQLGVSEELAKLERGLNWLATVAAVGPFIGLFGTVWGIIDSFQALGLAGSASLRAVAPGISESLIATAMGLGAAIPAAIAYNYFGYVIKELGARMEDFSLEFMNVAERNIEA
jgi:biopolymer transport protein TolQ